MIEAISPAETDSKTPKLAARDQTHPGHITVGHVLIGLAVLTAGAIVCLYRADLRIAHPSMLSPVCLSLMWPARSTKLLHLQAIVLCYLTWILFAAIFDICWRWAWPNGASLYMSSSLLPAALLLIGCVLSASRATGPVFPTNAAVFAVLLLVLHMAGVYMLLHHCYGFGWEEDFAVLGRVGLFMIVLAGTLRVSGCNAIRAGLGLVMALILLARSVSS